MKNKLLALFLSLVAVFSMIGFTACQDEEVDYGTLSVANITLEVGETKDILATFSKTEYADLAITYEENSDAISIANGQVTGLAEGVATVTATTANHTATFTVTVNPLPNYAFTIEDKQIEVGATAPVNAVFMDSANASEITYTFNKQGVISIADGVITAIKAGKVTVTAKTAQYTETFVVTVPDRAFEIADIEMYIGETKDIVAVFGDNTYAEAITYSFASNAIAINGNTINAYAAGTIVVTAKTAYATKTFNVIVADRGTLTIDNMSIPFGEATEIVLNWSNPDAAEALTYKYDTSKLLIENGKVTGLVENVTVNVTATSENFSVMFEVEVGTNYGSLVIADQDIIVGYYLNLPVEFTVDKFASEIEYEYDDTKIAIEDGIITVVDGVTSGTVAVTAKTARHETTFNVTIKDASALNAGRLDYFKAQVEKFPATEDSVLFIGDSFFDTRWFLTDFNTRFEGLDAYTYGTSSAQAFELLWWGQYIYDINPQAVVLNIGTNDIFDANMDSKGAIENVLNALYAFHVNMPETEIYWFTVIPRIGKDTAQIIALNDAVKAYAEEDNWLAVVDVYDIFANDTSLYKANDTVHPACPAGYDVMMEELAKAGLRINSLPDVPPVTTVEDWSTTKDLSLGKTKVDVPNAYGEFVVEFDVTVTDYKNNAHISLSFNDLTGYRFLLWDSKSTGTMYYGGQYGFTVDADGNASFGAYTNFNSSTNAYDITSKAKTVKIAVLVANEKAYLFADGVLQEVYLNAPAVSSFVIGTEGTSANFANLTVSKANFENSALFNTYLNNAPAYDFAPVKANVGTDSAANGAGNRIDAGLHTGNTLVGAEGTVGSLYLQVDGDSTFEGDFVAEYNVTAAIPASGWYFVAFGAATPAEIDKCWGATSPAMFTCPNGLTNSFAPWGTLKGDARAADVRNLKDINVIIVRQGERLIIALGVKADGENYAYTYVDGTYAGAELMLRIRQNACATTINNVSFATDEVSIGNAIEVVTGAAYSYAELNVGINKNDGSYVAADGVKITLTESGVAENAKVYEGTLVDGKLIIADFVPGNYDVVVDGCNALTAIAFVDGVNAINVKEVMFVNAKNFVVSDGTDFGYKVTSDYHGATVDFANAPELYDVYSFDFKVTDWRNNRLHYTYPEFDFYTAADKSFSVQLCGSVGEFYLKTANRFDYIGNASALVGETIHFDLVIVPGNVLIYMDGVNLGYALNDKFSDDPFTSVRISFYDDDKEHTNADRSDAWEFDNIIINSVDKDYFVSAVAINAIDTDFVDTRISISDYVVSYGDEVKLSAVIPEGYIVYGASVMFSEGIVESTYEVVNGKVNVSFVANGVDIYSDEYTVLFAFVPEAELDVSTDGIYTLNSDVYFAVEYIYGVDAEYLADGEVVTVYSVSNFGAYKLLGDFVIEDGYFVIEDQDVFINVAEYELDCANVYVVIYGDAMGIAFANAEYDYYTGSVVVYAEAEVYKEVNYDGLPGDYDNFDYTVEEDGTIFVESTGGKGGYFYFNESVVTDSVKIIEYTAYYQKGTQAYGGIYIGGNYFNSGVWNNASIAVKPLNKELPGNVRINDQIEVIDGVEYAYYDAQFVIQNGKVSFYYFTVDGKRIHANDYNISVRGGEYDLICVSHDDFKGKVKYAVKFYEGQEAIDMLNYEVVVGDTSLSDLTFNKTNLTIGEKLVGTITPYPAKEGMYVANNVTAYFFNYAEDESGIYKQYFDIVDVPFTIDTVTGIATFEYVATDFVNFSGIEFDVEVVKVDVPVEATITVDVTKLGVEDALADGKTATLTNLDAKEADIKVVYNATAKDGKLVFANVIPGEYALVVEDTYGVSTLIITADDEGKYAQTIKLDYELFILDNYNNVAFATTDFADDEINIVRADANNNAGYRLNFNSEVGNVTYLKFTVTDTVLANHTERAMTQMETDGATKGASYGTRWVPAGHNENQGDKTYGEFQYRSNNIWWLAWINDVKETGNVEVSLTTTIALAIENGTATFYQVNDNNEHVVIVRSNNTEWIHSDAYTMIKGIINQGYKLTISDIVYANTLDNLVVIETAQTEDKADVNGGYVSIDYTGKLCGDVAITVVPNEGYVFESLIVDGKDMTAAVKNGVAEIAKYKMVKGNVVATFAPVEEYVNVVLDIDAYIAGIGAKDFVPGEWFTLTNVDGRGYTFEVGEDGTVVAFLKVGDYAITSNGYYSNAVSVTALGDGQEFLNFEVSLVRKVTANAPDGNLTNYGYNSNGYYYTTNATGQANGIELYDSLGLSNGKVMAFTYENLGLRVGSNPEAGVNNVLVFKAFGNDGVATELQFTVWNSGLYVKSCHNGLLNSSKGDFFHGDFYLVVAEDGDFKLYTADGTFVGSTSEKCPNGHHKAGNGINRLVVYLDTSNSSAPNFKLSNIKVYDCEDINLSIAENADVEASLDVEVLSYLQTATLTATAVEGKVITQILANGNAIEFDVDADGVVTAGYTYFADFADVEFEIVTVDKEILNTLISVKSKFAWASDDTLKAVPAGTVVRLVAANGDTYVLTLGDDSSALTYAPHVDFVAFADGYVPTIVTLDGGKQEIVLNKDLVDSANGDFALVDYSAEGATFAKERGRVLGDHYTYITEALDVSEGLVISYTQKMEVNSYNYAYMQISNMYFAVGAWGGDALACKPFNADADMFYDADAVISENGINYREFMIEVVITPVEEGKFQYDFYVDRYAAGELILCGSKVGDHPIEGDNSIFLVAHPWHGEAIFKNIKVLEGADVVAYKEANKANVVLGESGDAEVEISKDVLSQLEASTITIDPIDAENAYYEVVKVTVNGKEVSFTKEGNPYEAVYTVNLVHDAKVSEYVVVVETALREDATLVLGTENLVGTNEVDLDADGVLTFGSDTVTVKLGAKVAVLKAYANGEEVEFINDQANHIAIITINHVDNAVDEYVLTYELADYRKVSGKITHKKLIDNDNIPQGQTLTLTDGVNTYTAVIGEDGSYEIEDVLVGSYTASIGTLAQYEANATATVVLGQDLVFDYEFNYRTINGHNANGNDTKIDLSQVNDGIISYVSPNKAVYSHFNKDMGDIKFVYFKFHEPEINSIYPGADASAIGFNLNMVKTYNNETAAVDGGIFGVHTNQGYWRTRWQQSGGLGWGAHGTNWDSVQTGKMATGDGLGIAVGIRDDGGFVVFVEQADGHLKSVGYCAPETNKINYIASIIGQLDVTITDLYIATSMPSKLYEDVTVYGEDGGSVEVTENNGLWGKTTVVATANDGYKLDYFTVNGVKVDGTSYTIDSTNAISVKAVASFSPVEAVVDNEVSLTINGKFNYETNDKAVPLANYKLRVTNPLGVATDITTDANGKLTITDAIDGDYTIAAATSYKDGNSILYNGIYTATITIVDGETADSILVDRLVVSHTGYNNKIVRGVENVGYVATYPKAEGNYYYDFDKSFMLEANGLLKINYKVAERADANVVSNGNTRSFAYIYLEGKLADGSGTDVNIQICNWNSRVNIKNGKTNGANGESFSVSGVGGMDYTFYLGVRDNAIVLYGEDGALLCTYRYVDTSKNTLASVHNVRFYRYVDKGAGIVETYTISGVDAQTINFVDKAEGATLAFDKSAIAFGEQATITATPNDGLVVTGIYVDGVKLDAVADGANVVANFRNAGSSLTTANVTVTTAQKAVKTLTADVKTMFPWDKYADVAKDGTVVNFVGDNGIFAATVAGGKISVDINDGTYSVDFGATSTPVTVTVADGKVANDSITLIKKFINTNNTEAMLNSLVENEDGIYLKKYANYRNYHEINSFNDNVDWTGKVVLTGEALIETGKICYAGVGLGEKYATNFGCWNGQDINTKPYNKLDCKTSDYYETIDGVKHAGVKFVQILDTDADLMTIKVYAMSTGALLTTYEIAESRIGFRMGCDDPQGQLILRNMKMLDGQDAVDFIASL